VGPAAIGAGSEFGFEIEVGGFTGSLEPVWADAADPALHTRQPTINLHAVVSLDPQFLGPQSILLLGRGHGIAGSLEPSIASEYACR
jgi:hypothetical protein